MEIVRTKEQIEALKVAIENELKNMPDRNIFGESNAESKAEMRDWIATMGRALAGQDIGEEDDEATYWLTDKRATLGVDYGVG